MILALTKEALKKQTELQETNITNEKTLIEKEFMFNRLNSPDFIEHRSWNFLELLLWEKQPNSRKCF